MIPEFEEAESQFRDYLIDNGLPIRIVWVAPEHTIFCRDEWKIFRGEGISEADIRATYKSASEQPFGIRLAVLCRDGDTSYCYLKAPVDEDDAERQLLVRHTLKMSIPTNMPHASLINRGMRSIWYQLLELRVRKWKDLYFGSQ